MASKDRDRAGRVYIQRTRSREEPQSIQAEHSKSSSRVTCFIVISGPALPPSLDDPRPIPARLDKDAAPITMGNTNIVLASNLDIYIL